MFERQLTLNTPELITIYPERSHGFQSLSLCVGRCVTEYDIWGKRPRIGEWRGSVNKYDNIICNQVIKSIIFY